MEQIDHTGDGGLRVTAASLPRLLTVCAEQMVRFCCPDGEIRSTVTRAVTIEGHDLVELLVGWLAEINTLMSLRYELYGRFHISELKTEGEPPLRLAGEVSGEPLTPQRHRIETEIKAVTYHEAYVRETASGWQCQVIFDL
ncbi:MAG: archease [bacterium]